MRDERREENLLPEQPAKNRLRPLVLEIVVIVMMMMVSSDVERIPIVTTRRMADVGCCRMLLPIG